MPPLQSTLPTSRKFVTQLLTSLRDQAPATFQTTSNPLVHASEAVKKILLTLHVLFPNELLPALDLLDRRLVTRFTICRDEEGHLPGNVSAVEGQDEAQGQIAAKAEPPSDTEMLDMPTTTQSFRPPTQQAQRPEIIYYVRSAQLRPSRTHTSSYDTLTSYQVRLLAWTCSCPAFAFAAFPAAHPTPAVPVYNKRGRFGCEEGRGLERREEDAWEFGGLAIGDEGMPPVCKHLLACVLAERCGDLLRGFVEERMVGVEEAAGWAAGWGE